QANEEGVRARTCMRRGKPGPRKAATGHYEGWYGRALYRTVILRAILVLRQDNSRGAFLQTGPTGGASALRCDCRTPDASATRLGDELRRSGIGNEEASATLPLPARFAR